MVVHFARRRNLRAAAPNLAGAIGTAIAVVVVLASKLREGAWISVLLMVAMILVFGAVRRHADTIERATETHAPLDVGPSRAPLAVVALRRWDAIALKALRFAIRFAPVVVAVQVLTGDDPDVEEDLRARWNELAVTPVKRLRLTPPETRRRQHAVVPRRPRRRAQRDG